MNQKYSKDSLGTRMKAYESVSSTTLMRRTPTIIRIDGKAFHTWTKQLKAQDPSLEYTPYSVTMFSAMMATTAYLVSNIQNAVLGYTQSDEISILLNDWKDINTDQWFGAKVQKMASVSSSMATAIFNHVVQDLGDFTPAMFDARVYNIPKEEVVNYFIWRQQDATRNSVQMFGRHYFSHKEMHKKNVSQVQDMLMLEKGVNWNDQKTWMKRGSCVRAIPCEKLQLDQDIPIFTQDRGYIEDLLKSNEA